MFVRHQETIFAHAGRSRSILAKRGVVPCDFIGGLYALLGARAAQALSSGGVIGFRPVVQSH